MRATFAEQFHPKEVIESTFPDLKLVRQKYQNSLIKKVMVGTYVVLNKFIEMGLPVDGEAACAMSTSWAFLTSNKKIYKMGEEFGKELLKVDIRIDEKYLNVTPEPILVEFPDGVTFNSPLHPDIFYKSAVITFMEVDRKAHEELNNEFINDGLPPDDFEEVRQLAIILPLYDKNGTLRTGDPRVSLINIAKGEDLKESLLECLKLYSAFEYEVVKYVINSMIYINSGNPDLREYKAPIKPNNFKGRERNWIRQNRGNVMHNMTLVGFNYKKPTLFNMDSTSVSGHFRWQPYGEALSKVKLIWIDSHERTYKNVKGNMEVSSSQEEAV